MTTTTTAMITIYRTADGWVADMRHAPDAARIRALFGTTDIPTPYAPTMPEATVIRALGRLNPGVTIEAR